MSFGKKFGSNTRPMSDREVEIKHKMFERLSEKGILESMQQQLRRAFAQEFNECKADASDGQQSDGRETDLKRNSNKMTKEEDIVEESDQNWDSLEKVSSIAIWEKQIRHELEIHREIQTRELERQRDRLRTETKKLSERDKCLRIELDARERKIRLREEELETRSEDLETKASELVTKEETINCIVNEKIKTELKDEIERLKKKFNELEKNKLSLTKREEKLKEMERRVVEQTICIKDKIDCIRTQEIESAKSRKDLEIIRKENEVLKEKVNSMEDYQVIRFENKSLKSELNAIKESLKNRLIELEVERERLEKCIKQTNDKVLNLRMNLSKSDHELLLLKQKHQGEIDEYEYKLEQLNNQLKQSKLVAQHNQIKNNLLTKELVSTQRERTQNSIKCNQTLNNNLTQTDGQNYGCYICDHNIKAVEESSVDFVLSQKYISANNEIMSEQNLDFQTQKSATNGLNANEERFGLKNSTEQMQNSVPLSKTLPTSHTIHAIPQLTTPNTCAKHNAKLRQNGIQLMQTNEDNRQTIEEKGTEGNTYNNNIVNKQKSDKNSVEDNDKDIDISETFEW